MKGFDEVSGKEVIMYITKKKNLSNEELKLKRKEATRDYSYIKYLDNINLTYEEYQILLTKRQFVDLYHQAFNAYLTDDLRTLVEIKEECLPFLNKQPNNKYQHLVDSINIWQAKYTDKQLQECALIEYLNKIELWTLHEIRMLKGIILVIDFELTKKLYTRSRKVLKARSINHEYELLWLDLYYLIRCIGKRNSKTIEILITRIKNKLSDKYWLTEKVAVVLIEDVWQIIEEPYNANKYEQLKNDMMIVSRFNCERLTQGIIKLLNQLLNENEIEKIGIELSKYFPF